MKQNSYNSIGMNPLSSRDNIIYETLLLLGLDLLCLSGMTFIFAVGLKFFVHVHKLQPGTAASFIALTILSFLIYSTAMKIYGGLELSSQPGILIFSQLIAIVLSNLVLFAVAWFAFPSPFKLTDLLLIILTQAAFCLIWGRTGDKICKKVIAPQRAAVIYEKDEDTEYFFNISRNNRKFDIVKYLKIDRNLEEILERIRDVDVVFLYGASSTVRDHLLQNCSLRGLQVYIKPRLEDVLLSGSGRVSMFDETFLHYDVSTLPMGYMVSKRVLDIILSLLGILAASPIMLVVAAGIKLYDQGPVFYSQTRLTKGNKTFEILKFRSMVTNAEGDGVVRLASKNDRRITPIGKIIRATRLDELPQLFNILKGDMTFVGPRPERPEIARQYEKGLPEFSLRLRVKAGLTGYAQVYGKYNSTPYNKLQMDLIYISCPSILEDLRLMLLTAKIILIPDRTEGVGEGQTTAARITEKKKEILLQGDYRQN